uniref:Ubiquitin-like domain-containing protein n=1 Tax=Noctiluca scintillans TaxID=2966 RepID=A0A7S1ABC8_NOCSC
MAQAILPQVACRTGNRDHTWFVHCVVGGEAAGSLSAFRTAIGLQAMLSLDGTHWERAFSLGGSASLTLFARLPAVARPLRKLFLPGTPERTRCLEALVAPPWTDAQLAEVSKASSVGPANGIKQEELQARCSGLTRQRQLIDVAIFAFKARDVEALKLCMFAGLDVNRPLGAGGHWPITLCMKIDWPEGLLCLLGFPSVQLPFPTHTAKPPLTRLDETGTLVGHWQDHSKNVAYGSSKVGVDIEGFNPLYTGAFHHSYNSCTALLRFLSDSATRVHVAPPQSEDEQVVLEQVAVEAADGCHFWPGLSYLEASMTARFASHQELILPKYTNVGNTSGHGAGYVKWQRRYPTSFLVGPTRMPSQLWTLLDSEVRRPDLDTRIVRLLLRHHDKSERRKVAINLFRVVEMKERAAKLLTQPVSTLSAAKDGDLDLTIAKLTGEVALRANFAPYMSVQQVKREIHAATTISEGRQMLLLDGVVLEDTPLLCELGLPERGAELQIAICDEDFVLEEQLKELHDAVGWFGVSSSREGLILLADLRSLLHSVGGP